MKHLFFWHMLEFSYLRAHLFKNVLNCLVSYLLRIVNKSVEKYVIEVLTNELKTMVSATTIVKALQNLKRRESVKEN